jgi:hypothetical protein
MAEETSAPEGVRGVLDINGATQALTEILNRENDTSEQQEPQQEALEEDAGLEEGEFDDADPEDLYDDEDSELADQYDDDGEDDAPIEPRKYTVKAAGETFEVSEDELISGYQRQADYTRSKQEISETRKKLESELQGAQAERQRMSRVLQTVQAQLQSQDVKPPDEELRDLDPTEYLLQKDAYDRHQMKLRAIAGEQKRIADQQQQQYQQALSEMREKENAALLDRIPEWQDNSKRETDTKQMMAYARDKLGYSEDELMQIYDSRLVLALQKLWKYESQAAPDSKARKKVSQAQRVVRNRAVRSMTLPQFYFKPKEILK